MNAYFDQDKKLFSVEAERSLLGNMILYDIMNDIQEAGITAADFYLDKHKTIFDTIAKMHRDYDPIDSVTLSERLKETGQLDRIGGYEYILSLTEATISQHHTKQYCKILKDRSFDREVVRIGNQLVESILSRSNSGEPGAAIRTAINQLSKLQNVREGETQ
ncbi:MAG: hypothetical protein K6D92_04485 [Erysipelotrichaceae bacterium]|nr:hypothetical protein [Erysipelotrichaceae bacterium]